MGVQLVYETHSTSVDNEVGRATGWLGGALSDAVLSRAAAVGARVALLPCCHLTRWRPDLVDRADPAARIDAERAVWLVERGYDVIVDTIPANVSAKNRLLLGRPRVTA